MVRLFTALSIPDDVAEALVPLQAGVPGARWRAREQLHITLSFYGEVDERRADELAVELERAAAGGAFDIALSGVGAFGDNWRTRTLWAGIQAGVSAHDRLSVLAGRCVSAAKRAGLAVEARAYRPHLTLAYLKSEADAARIGGWIAEHNLLKSSPIRIDRFGLYSSVLTEGGSTYALEAEYVL